MQIVQINNANAAAKAMQEIGVTSRGVEIMVEKALLSQGAEAAVSAATINLAAPYTDVLVLATVAQLRRAIPRLQEQPWGLKAVAKELEEYINGIMA